MSNSECTDYKIKIYDLLVPPYQTLYKICTIREKTYMFILAIIRLYILYKIIKYLQIHYDVKFNVKKPYRLMLYVTLIIYMLINISVLIIITFKKPDINKNVDSEIATEIAKVLKTDGISKSY